MNTKSLDQLKNRGWVPNEVKKELDQAAAKVYQLKITLVGLEPPVWRRVLVPGDASLGSLHRVIQYAMGWSDCHLHMFHVGKTRIAPRTPDWDDVEDERKFVLWDIARKTGAKFFYEYDMGDSWGHEIKVESITPATGAFKGPECLAGAGACPPEDCGGIGGCEDLLAALRDPKHEQHDEMVDWVGGDYDPKAFDLAAANKALGRKK
ncbi:MAG TPA: plasmid pRiA4b ORF-3 family protein [Elusimicrobiota bacterium]|nr:plasmid pRiA4b ORF-3 family protein [Elusimicrobiota bacterium]